MKTILWAGAAIALSAGMAAPAAAQVSGIGVADPAVVVAGSQARVSAYTQIETTFAAQRAQLEQNQQQLSTILRPFDVNSDGQLDETERATLQANATAAQQVQSLEQIIATTRQPIIAAQAYAIEQIAQQLNAAVEQVLAASNVHIILPPNSVVYASETANLTDEIVAALNQRVPTVSTAVPQGWQPLRSSFELYQQVQQVLLNEAIRQAQQQAAQQQQQPAAVQGR